MRSRSKFVREFLGFSLKNIKKLEVKFNPFHPNAANVREFYQAATDLKALTTNPETVYKATVVSNNSDPLVTVQFIDDHKLVINSKYLESSHIVRLIRQFEQSHKDEPENI